MRKNFKKNQTELANCHFKSVQKNKILSESKLNWSAKKNCENLLMTSYSSSSSRNFGFDIDMDMDLIEDARKRGESQIYYALFTLNLAQ